MIINCYRKRGNSKEKIYIKWEKSNQTGIKEIYVNGKNLKERKKNQ